MLPWALYYFCMNHRFPPIWDTFWIILQQWVNVNSLFSLISLKYSKSWNTYTYRWESNRYSHIYKIYWHGKHRQAGFTMSTWPMLLFGQDNTFSFAPQKFATLWLDKLPTLLNRHFILITLSILGLEFPTLIIVLYNPPPICISFFVSTANSILRYRHPSITKHLVLRDHVSSIFWLLFLNMAALLGLATCIGPT
jgi:hypothetical protein